MTTASPQVLIDELQKLKQNVGFQKLIEYIEEEIEARKIKLLGSENDIEQSLNILSEWRAYNKALYSLKHVPDELITGLTSEIQSSLDFSQPLV